jgi:hypothetical protein
MARMVCSDFTQFGNAERFSPYQSPRNDWAYKDLRLSLSAKLVGNSTGVHVSALIMNYDRHVYLSQ